MSVFTYTMQFLQEMQQQHVHIVILAPVSRQFTAAREEDDCAVRRDPMG
jgi:hypothetical protein